MNAAYRQKGRDAMFKVWHASEESLIMYMHSEGGSIVCAEKTYPIKKGVLCFIGKGKYHYTMPKISAEYDRSKLFLSSSRQSLLTQLSASLPFLRAYGGGAFAYALIPEEEREEVERVFARAVECASDPGYAEPLLLSSALVLFTYLDQYAVGSVPRSESFLDRAVEYVNENLTGELTVDSICAAVHISKYHFCRCFKQTMGITPMEYVLKTRLAAAAELLSATELSVTEVGMRCGFSSPAYFSRVFKEDVGESPLRYRKTHTK